MITPTGVTAEAYWNAIKNGNTTHVRISFTGQNIILEDEDINSQGGININDVLNSETDLVFGSAVSKQITVAILNSSKLTGLDWAGEFTLEFGVEIGGTTNWVNVGYFKGDKPKNVTTSNVISFTAYDRMRMFDTLADDYVQSITYPATLQSIYNGLCTFIGVQNVQGDELSSSMGRTFASAPMEMEGYACRDLLSLIAEACGCYAKINSAGNVQMVWFSDQTSYALTGNDEFNAESVDASDAVPAVDQVLIKQLDSDMDILYPDNITGQNVYMIVSNPFLAVSQAQDITDYIVPIYNRLNSFGGYLPVSVECVGNWLVETGDIITVDVNGDDFVVPIFVRNFRWNGATNDSYESTGNSKREALLENNKQKIMNATEIKLLVKDKYYEKENGIVIDQNGVNILGNKHVELTSGNNSLEITPNGLSFAGGYSKIDSGNYYTSINEFRFTKLLNYENKYICTLDVYEYNVAYRLGSITFFADATNYTSHGEIRFFPSNQSNYSLNLRMQNGNLLLFADGTVQFGSNVAPYNRIDYIYVNHLNYLDGYQASSKDIKHDIKKLESVGDKFDKLEPVTFVYNDDPNEKQRMGLIYEDTIDVMPEICSNNENDKAINYLELIPALLKEIKDLRKRVAELENKVNDTN